MAIEILKNRDAFKEAVARFQKHKGMVTDLPLIKEISIDLLREVQNEISAALPFDHDFSLEMEGVIDSMAHEIDARIEEENDPDAQAGTYADMAYDAARGA